MRPTADGQRLGEGGADPLGHGAGVQRVGQPGAQDDELVTAEPGQGVRLAQHPPDPSGDRDEQLVAHGVASGVVDQLEAVEVDEHDGHVRPVHVGIDRGQQPQQFGPVDQPGERVVPGRSVEALLVADVCGHVVQQNEHDIVVTVPRLGRQRRHRDREPAVADRRCLPRRRDEVRIGGGGNPDRSPRRAHLQRLALDKDRAQVDAQQRLDRSAQQQRGPGIRVQDGGRPSVDPACAQDRYGRLVEDGPEQAGPFPRSQRTHPPTTL